MTESLLILGNGAPSHLESAPVGSIYIDSTNLPSSGGEKLNFGNKIQKPYRGDGKADGVIAQSFLLSAVSGWLGIYDINAKNGDPSAPKNSLMNGSYLAYVPANNTDSTIIPFTTLLQLGESFSDETPTSIRVFKSSDEGLNPANNPTQEQQTKAIENATLQGNLLTSKSMTSLELDLSNPVAGYVGGIYGEWPYTDFAYKFPQTPLGSLTDGNPCTLPDNSGNGGTSGNALAEFVQIQVDDKAKAQGLQISVSRLNQTSGGINPTKYPLNWVDVAIVSKTPQYGESWQNNSPLSLLSPSNYGPYSPSLTVGKSDQPTTAALTMVQNANGGENYTGSDEAHLFVASGNQVAKYAFGSNGKIFVNTKELTINEKDQKRLYAVIESGQFPHFVDDYVKKHSKVISQVDFSETLNQLTVLQKQYDDLEKRVVMLESSQK